MEMIRQDATGNESLQTCNLINTVISYWPSRLQPNSWPNSVRSSEIWKQCMVGYLKFACGLLERIWIWQTCHTNIKRKYETITEMYLESTSWLMVDKLQYNTKIWQATESKKTFKNVDHSAANSVISLRRKGEIKAGAVLAKIHGWTAINRKEGIIIIRGTKSERNWNWPKQKYELKVCTLLGKIGFLPVFCWQKDWQKTNFSWWEGWKPGKDWQKTSNF